MLGMGSHLFNRTRSLACACVYVCVRVRVRARGCHHDPTNMQPVCLMSGTLCSMEYQAFPVHGLWTSRCAIVGMVVGMVHVCSRPLLCAAGRILRLFVRKSAAHVDGLADGGSVHRPCKISLLKRSIISFNIHVPSLRFVHAGTNLVTENIT